MNVFKLMIVVFSFAFGYPILRYLHSKCFVKMIQIMKDRLEEKQARNDERKRKNAERLNELVIL